MAYGAHFGGSPAAPPGAVDPLTQQLIDAGLVDDQAQLLAQQMRHGQGLMQTPGAQGMNVGGTYRASSPLEHLSVAMSRIMGGRQVHDAQKGLAQGIETKRAGRQAFAGAQSGLPGIPSAEELLAPPAQPQWSPPDFGGPAPTVDGVTGTPAQRLAGAMDARSKLGLLGALSGDPTISGAAQGLTAEARGLGQTGFNVAQGNRQFGLDQQRLVGAEEARRVEQERWARQQDENERHNRATEARPPSYPVIIGDGGQQYRIDPRNPAAPAVPVMDASGKPVLKPQGGGHGGMAEVAERKRVMLSDGQLKTVAEYDRFLDALRDIGERKAKIDTGPVASRRNVAASKVGADDPNVSAFRAMVGDSLATYIRNLSGAAVSDKERAFLIQNVPKMEDNDQVFSAKLQAVTERLTRLRGMELDLFGKQGKDVSGFTGGAPSAHAEHGAPDAPRRRRYNPETGTLE